MRKLLVAATVVAGCGMFALTGETVKPPALFTAAQAEAGRAFFQSKPLGSFDNHRCAECHNETLLGNDGTGDVPEFRQKFKSVVVPPLAGEKFMKKWGDRTTKDLYTRISQVTKLDQETYLDLVAYILQSNGAPSGTQPLTAQTVFVIDAATPR